MSALTRGGVLSAKPANSNSHRTSSKSDIDVEAKGAEARGRVQACLLNAAGASRNKTLSISPLSVMYFANTGEGARRPAGRCECEYKLSPRRTHRHAPLSRRVRVDEHAIRGRGFRPSRPGKHGRGRLDRPRVHRSSTGPTAKRRGLGGSETSCGSLSGRWGICEAWAWREGS